jgi:hypothetical protein
MTNPQHTSKDNLSLLGTCPAHNFLVVAGKDDAICSKCGCRLPLLAASTYCLGMVHGAQAAEAMFLANKAIAAIASTQPANPEMLRLLRDFTGRAHTKGKAHE